MFTCQRLNDKEGAIYVKRKELQDLRVVLTPQPSGSLLAEFKIQPLFVDRIREAQKDDPLLVKRLENVREGEESKFSLHKDGTIRFKDRLCVPNSVELRRELLEEAHCSKYTAHPGGTKMYRDLRELYWWEGMKKDIIAFVAQCLTCQIVKAEHQRPAGLLQPLPIPEWKWEHVTMDFVVGLPKTEKGTTRYG